MKKGFAFLRPEDEDMEDIFIPRRKLIVPWMEILLL
ncbi:hypothetical protein ACVXZZ_10760 [Staphylococcus aureus]